MPLTPAGGMVYTAYHEQKRGTNKTQSLLREMVSLEESAERWSGLGGRIYGVAMNALTLTQVAGTRPVPPTMKK